MRLEQSHRIVDALKDQGAVALPGFFAPDVVERMRAEALVLLSASTEGTVATNNPGGTAKRVEPELLAAPRFPALGSAMTSALCREVAHGYDAESTFLCDAVITHNTAPAKITDVHFDMRRSLKFMIYLSDVDKECAAFRYAYGTHKANRELRDRLLVHGGRLKSLPNIPAPDERIDLVDLEGPKGTFIIFDTDGFHSAGALQPGRERLLIRSRTRLSGWSNNRYLRLAAEINPLRFFLPLPVPRGRKATGGRSRAK